MKPVDISKIKHLYPFESKHIDINGLDYHYLDEGSGHPVLMLHGNPTWSFYYRNLVKAFSDRYRTIVPDHIGCGLSEKPGIDDYDYRLESRISDLDHLISHLDLSEKLTLVVHDWGGMIGMTWAVRNPERIKRLVIMNTAAFPPPSSKPIPLRLQIVRNMTPFAVPAVLRFNLFAAGALYMASHKGLAKDVKAGMIAPYNCPENRIATLKFVQDIPLKENDPGYSIVKNTKENLGLLKDIPMLILWGAHDFVFDLDYFKEWEKHFPKAETHVFEDAGHYVLEDESDRIIELIDIFLKQS
ncbi:alpha/beta fold hydrolase [Desulfobacterales bacterium HSG16]|nr:alpha/beta fold hydrolase [Desulfobacterales bacterium HSG16]